MKSWLLVSVICTASCLEYHTKEELEAKLQPRSGSENPAERVDDTVLCEGGRLSFQCAKYFETDQKGVLTWRLSIKNWKR